jgi:hypothetical protein
MAWVIPNSTSVNNVAVPLTAGNDLFVAANVSIASTGFFPAVTGDVGNEIVVFGTITNEASQCIKISAGLFTANANFKLTIGDTGQIVNLAGGAAIAVQG